MEKIKKKAFFFVVPVFIAVGLFSYLVWVLGGSGPFLPFYSLDTRAVLARFETANAAIFEIYVGVNDKSLAERTGSKISGGATKAGSGRKAQLTVSEYAQIERVIDLCFVSKKHPTWDSATTPNGTADNSSRCFSQKFASTNHDLLPHHDFAPSTGGVPGSTPARYANLAQSPFLKPTRGPDEIELEFLQIFDQQRDDGQLLATSLLTQAQLEHLSLGAPLVRTDRYLILKMPSGSGAADFRYRAYDINDFYSHLENTPFQLSDYSPGDTCLLKTGNGCWQLNARTAMSQIRQYAIAIVAALVAFLTMCSVYYVRSRAHRNHEQRKNRLALQVLSHEFRTPVSSLLLLLDRLIKKQNRLDTGEQDLVTRISAEVYRLQRIIEISKTYLQTGSRRIRFNKIEIPSVNEWISDFAAELDHEVTCELLTHDKSIKADPFWLKFVLSNLAQNAFLHGKPPVIIRLASEAQQVKIAVEDHGECEFSSLSEMTAPFVKSRKSRGMGLGLNITQSILKEWGIRFQFTRFPKSFSIQFPCCRES